jgi:flagellar M-ring protein FliF
MDPFQRLLTQLRTFWNGLGTARKIALVGVTLIIFAALATYSVLSATTGSNYVPVFSDQAIPIEEVQAARTKLTAQNIDSKVTEDGTLRVPLEKRPMARVILAADGIPSRGGKGYEIFDETSLGSTPFVQNVNYQRALQAELARSIMHLEPVLNARVLIAKPESTPFIRERRATTASVVLKLKPGAKLDAAAAANIVSLVARSVDGLLPEHVTVVDSSGRLLSDPRAGDRDGLPAAQLQYREEVERHLAAKAEELLTSHLGRGRAIVKVSADINFQKVREQQVTYPTDGKVTAAERSTNIQTTAASRAGGVAGARSNLPPVGVGATTTGGAGTSKEEVLQTDYSLSKTTRDVENDRAALQRLNVAAIIDLTPPEDGTTGGPTMTVAEAEEIIKQAVGYMATRGDQIKVSNARLGSAVALPVETTDDEAAQFQRFQNYVSLTRNISFAVAVVLTTVLIALVLLRRRQRTVSAAPEVIATTVPAPGPPPEERRRELVDRLKQMADSEPDRVAEVLTILSGGKK